MLHGFPRRAPLGSPRTAAGSPARAWPTPRRAQLCYFALHEHLSNTELSNRGPSKRRAAVQNLPARFLFVVGNGNPPFIKLPRRTKLVITPPGGRAIQNSPRRTIVARTFANSPRRTKSIETSNGIETDRNSPGQSPVPHVRAREIVPPTCVRVKLPPPHVGAVHSIGDGGAWGRVPRGVLPVPMKKKSGRHTTFFAI